MKKYSIDFESLANLEGHVNAYWFDTQHKILGCNQALAEMMYKHHNLRLSDFIGRRLQEVLSPQCKHLVDIAIQENEEVLKLGVSKQYINTLIMPDHYKIKMLTLKAPYYDEDGKIAGVFGISHYINEVSLAGTRELKFSSRETECLMLMLKGNTMREMSEKLHISLKTVGTYIERLKAKLGCTTRSELISKAIDLGLQQDLLS